MIKLMMFFVALGFASLVMASGAASNGKTIVLYDTQPEAVQEAVRTALQELSKPVLANTKNNAAYVLSDPENVGVEANICVTTNLRGIRKDTSNDKKPRTISTCITIEP